MPLCDYMVESDSDYELAVRFVKFGSEPMARQLRLQKLREILQEEVLSAVSLVDFDLTPVPLATSIVDEGKLLMENTLEITTKLY